MAHNLAKSSTEEMGGFRIEVTLQAPTLQEAKDKVATLPFLDIKWWAGLVVGSTKKVDIKVVDKKGLLGNTRWMYQRAQETGFLNGRNARMATSEQKQVCADLLASFGWNGGKRNITKSLDPSAWWREDQLPDEGQPPVPDRTTTILSNLTTHYQSREGIKRLLAILRKGATKSIPCQRSGAEAGHKYWVQDTDPFRLKCKKCNHILTEADAFKWFAHLVANGHVPLSSIGHNVLRPEQAQQVGVTST